MPFGDGKLLGKAIGARFPIAGAIFETLTPQVVEAIRGSHSVESLHERVEEAAKNKPEVVNNLNLESPIQSGTTLAMGGALLTSGGVVIAMVRSGDIDVGMLSTQLAIIIASILGLWRRWGSGLKPLFSRGK